MGSYFSKSTNEIDPAYEEAANGAFYGPFTPISIDRISQENDYDIVFEEHCIME